MDDTIAKAEKIAEDMGCKSVKEAIEKLEEKEGNE